MRQCRFVMGQNRGLGEAATLPWMASQLRTRLWRDGSWVTLSWAVLLIMELDLDPGRLQAGRRGIVAAHALLSV